MWENQPALPAGHPCYSSAPHLHNQIILEGKEEHGYTRVFWLTKPNFWILAFIGHTPNSVPSRIWSLLSFKQNLTPAGKGWAPMQLTQIKWKLLSRIPTNPKFPYSPKDHSLLPYFIQHCERQGRAVTMEQDRCRVSQCPLNLRWGPLWEAHLGSIIW